VCGGREQKHVKQQKQSTVQMKQNNCNESVVFLVSPVAITAAAASSSITPPQF
jgi:hypothetical protein